MKRIQILLLAAVLALGLAACGAAPSTSQSEAQSEAQSVVQPEATPEATPEVTPEATPEIPAGPAVTVTHTEDADLENCDVFREPDLEIEDPMLFHADREVHDFRFFSLNWSGEGEDSKAGEDYVLYTQPSLTPDRDLLIVTAPVGDMLPGYGISYVENGELKSFMISSTGEGDPLIAMESAVG